MYVGFDAVVTPGGAPPTLTVRPSNTAPSAVSNSISSYDATDSKASADSVPLKKLSPRPRSVGALPLLAGQCHDQARLHVSYSAGSLAHWELHALLQPDAFALRMDPALTCVGLLLEWASKSCYGPQPVLGGAGGGGALDLDDDGDGDGGDDAAAAAAAERGSAYTREDTYSWNDHDAITTAFSLWPVRARSQDNHTAGESSSLSGNSAAANDDNDPVASVRAAALPALPPRPAPAVHGARVRRRNLALSLPPAVGAKEVKPPCPQCHAVPSAQFPCFPHCSAAGNANDIALAGLLMRVLDDLGHGPATGNVGLSVDQRRRVTNYLFPAVNARLPHTSKVIFEYLVRNTPKEESKKEISHAIDLSEYRGLDKESVECNNAEFNDDSDCDDNEGVFSLPVSPALDLALAAHVSVAQQRLESARERSINRQREAESSSAVLRARSRIVTAALAATRNNAPFVAKQGSSPDAPPTLLDVVLVATAGALRGPRGAWAPGATAACVRGLLQALAESNDEPDGPVCSYNAHAPSSRSDSALAAALERRHPREWPAVRQALLLLSASGPDPALCRLMLALGATALLNPRSLTLRKRLAGLSAAAVVEYARIQATHKFSGTPNTCVPPNAAALQSLRGLSDEEIDALQSVRDFYAHTKTGMGYAENPLLTAVAESAALMLTARAEQAAQTVAALADACGFEAYLRREKNMTADKAMAVVELVKRHTERVSNGDGGEDECKKSTSDDSITTDDGAVVPLSEALRLRAKHLVRLNFTLHPPHSPCISTIACASGPGRPSRPSPLLALLLAPLLRLGLWRWVS